MFCTKLVKRSLLFFSEEKTRIVSSVIILVPVATDPHLSIAITLQGKPVVKCQRLIATRVFTGFFINDLFKLEFEKPE